MSKITKRKGVDDQVVPSAGGGSRQADAPNERSADRVVGLDVGGRLYYANLSTLTNPSAYFAARFGGNMDPGAAYRDDRGREVYFLDRSDKLFGHILDFLRSGVPTWPSYREDPVLWRRLRVEAGYFGIEALADLLHKTYQCSPGRGDKGVLHWLGTEKGAKEYQNPYAIGEVDVTGWLDQPNVALEYQEAITEKERRVFVQHRPVVERVEVDSPSRLAVAIRCNVLMCDQAKGRNSSVVAFKTVSVRPTHYSLRYGECFSMDAWDFEGSTDGILWDTLHKARRDPHLLRPSVTQMKVLHLLLEQSDEEQMSPITTDWVERNCRHTWELDPAPSKFYSHFRFIGIGEREFARLREERGLSGCMHGVGFEVFGDVHED